MCIDSMSALFIVSLNVFSSVRRQPCQQRSAARTMCTAVSEPAPTLWHWGNPSASRGLTCISILKICSTETAAELPSPPLRVLPPSHPRRRPCQGRSALPCVRRLLPSDATHATTHATAPLFPSSAKKRYAGPTTRCWNGRWKPRCLQFEESTWAERQRHPHHDPKGQAAEIRRS